MNKKAHRLIFKKEKAGTDNKIKKINIILKLNKILIKKKLLAFL